MKKFYRDLIDQDKIIIGQDQDTGVTVLAYISSDGMYQPLARDVCPEVYIEVIGYDDSTQ